MKSVIIPTTDVNSETGIIVAWKADNRSWVTKGDVLVDIETSKAVIEVPAPENGFVLHSAATDVEVSLARPVAYIFPDTESLAAFERELTKKRHEQEHAQAYNGVRATHKAKQRAAELGVDLSCLDTSRLITVKEVEAAAALSVIDPASLPRPLSVDASVERVLLIGGGLGAKQVISIFEDSSKQQAVAIVDDDRKKWGALVEGVPVVGGIDRLEQLYQDSLFDSAIITISTSVGARTRFRTVCERLHIPLTNAIDRTAKISRGVEMGTGNVICAFCHFGAGAKIGHNNFISAYNSYDHHNVLGNDISTGPGCITSALVKIGDRVRLGIGIFIEPGLELGAGVQVASGAIILRSVPAEHAVKTRTITTTVVPIRPWRGQALDAAR